jgi:hypothetical protein
LNLRNNRKFEKIFSMFKLFFLLNLHVLLISNLFSQTNNVQIQVMDIVNKDKLVGANVLLLGKNSGAQTDD